MKRYVVLSLIQNEWGLDHQGDEDFFWAKSPESAINQCKKYIKYNGTGPHWLIDNNYDFYGKPE